MRAPRAAPKPRFPAPTKGSLGPAESAPLCSGGLHAQQEFTKQNTGAPGVQTDPIVQTDRVVQTWAPVQLCGLEAVGMQAHQTPFPCPAPGTPHVLRVSRVPAAALGPLCTFSHPSSLGAVISRSTRGNQGSGCLVACASPTPPCLVGPPPPLPMFPAG